MPFQKGHKGFRTKESYRKSGIKVANHPNSIRTRFKKGSSGFTGKHTEETKKKIREARARQGSNVWNKGLPKEESHLFGRKLPESHRKKIGEAQKGSKNHNWKGGITPLRAKIRHTFEYHKWRSDIFIRDNYTCKWCKVRGGKIAADHYPKAFSEILNEYEIKTLEQALECEELWNINNGRTLCHSCHLTTDNYGGKIRKKK